MFTSVMRQLRPKKTLGQNFLTDPYYLQKIVDCANVGSDDRVLEIGPGMGHLTRLLCDKAHKVVALEIDERLVNHLLMEFSGVKNLELVQADALRYPFDSLAGKWRVVANLPYYISTPIIQKLIKGRDRFTSLTLMLQKEVAERIASPPGGKEYGYISVLVQLHAEPRIEFTVPAAAFHPQPDVESAVITLAIREKPAVHVKDEGFLLRLVKAAFSQRRKTLRNSLKQLNIPKQKMEYALRNTGIDPGRRAETLSVEEFGALSNFLCL